jgi:hypothetical protein
MSTGRSEKGLPLDVRSASTPGCPTKKKTAAASPASSAPLTALNASAGVRGTSASANYAPFSDMDNVQVILSLNRFLTSSGVLPEAHMQLFPTVFGFDAVCGHLFKTFAGKTSAIHSALFSLDGSVKAIYTQPPWRSRIVRSLGNA